MMYFDNINYYYLDGTFRVGTFVEQLGHFESIFPYGESFAKPSEMSLIGEFRINESDAASGIGWEFDAGFTISLDTSNMATPLPVTGVEALTDGLKLDITTTISKDAAGNLSFSIGFR